MEMKGNDWQENKYFDHATLWKPGEYVILLDSLHYARTCSTQVS